MQARVSKLGLGAAQFRLEGVAGVRGRSPRDQAAEILHVARRAGMDLLDAAVPYPSAETLLGEAMRAAPGFRLMIKTARDFVEAEARASLKRLGSPKGYAVVVQSAGDLFGPHGPALWDKLQDLKDQGLFEKIGVSALVSDDPAKLKLVGKKSNREAIGAWVRVKVGDQLLARQVMPTRSYL